MEAEEVMSEFSNFVSDWNRLHFRGDQGKGPKRDRGDEAAASRPASSIVKRLRSHDGILPLPVLRLGKELQSLPKCDIAIGDPGKLEELVRLCLATIDLCDGTLERSMSACT